MLQPKKCKFCGLEFRSRSASDADYCNKCSATRREMAGRQFLSESGKSIILGKYLLSAARAVRFGLRDR